MSNDTLIKTFLDAGYEERVALLKFIKQYYFDTKNLPLRGGLESFPVTESFRKSQSINFAPSVAGCPVCGK
ncbi:hypothetical protein RF240_21680 [Dickeya dadantii]|uniref:hypothetical protein n=1 Tax=Dickeya dadantii TaxID=204038 RepID=UPI001115A126|nr:hypothetical protein [Dickeya dadantii]